MAETKTMNVKVVELTKFGFKDDKGAYVGWSKHFKEADKTQVVPGRQFSVDMYIADSGKQYVNKIIRQLDSLKSGDVPVVVTPESLAAVKAVTKKFFPIDKETMSKAEWSAKDRSQLIGGLSHDAATLTAALMTMQPAERASDVLPIYKEFLEGMLKIRDEVK